MTTSAEQHAVSGRSVMNALARKFPTGTPEELTERFYDEIELPAPWRDILRSIIRDQARDLLREAVRRKEREAFGHTGAGGRPSGGGNVAPLRPLQPELGCEALESLSHQMMTMPDGRRVKWGSATVAMHRERLGALRQQRDAVQTTIAQHETILAQLTAAGVDTIDALIALLRQPKGRAS